MWNKLEKIYKKYIKNLGDGAIHLLNLIICFKISKRENSLVSFDKFVKEIKANSLDVILGVNINNSWSTSFLDIVSELSTIEVKNESDIVNISYLFEKMVNRREKGTYYTPNDVTKYITVNTIKNAILSKLNYSQLPEINNFDNLTNNLLTNRHFGGNKMKFVKAIKSLKILDPTCGSGAFLLTAFSELFKILKYLDGSSSNESEIAISALNTLYGVDIEPAAVTITKTLMLMEILMVDGTKGFNAFPWNNFKTGNSLWGDTDFSGVNDYINKKTDSNGKKLLEAPFVWKKEFNDIKFDCIIGNPPYIELSKARKSYRIDSNFKYSKCGNVYALVLERSMQLLSKKGFLGMIIPISFISTNRMAPIFNHVLSNSERLYVSSFADRPSCLFSGVHQKLNIIFAKKGKNGDLFTSSYYHWYKNEQPQLFSRIRYIENSQKIKIGSPLEKSIVRKVQTQPKFLSDYFSSSSTPYCLYVNTRAAFFIKTSLYPQKSKEFKPIYFHNERILHVVNSLLNSNLVFVLWEMFGDGWHVQLKFDFLRFDLNTLSSNDVSILKNLSKEISNNLEKNKVKIDSKQTEYEYKHKMAKNIMDEIDEIVGKSFGFTKKEINYLKQYNIKSRLSDYYYNYLDTQEK